MLARAAPAKINLGLHVLRKRDDGFHDVETVLVRIPWADDLRVTESDDLRLSCSDPGLTEDDSNLVLRAARALARKYGISRGAAFRLEKHLPAGAGLGGGSSDAAAALRLLNALWDLRSSDEELRALAADLGSDVPFFLHAPAAIGTGRGERLAPLIDPATEEVYRLPFSIVVAVPDVHVSTANAYEMVSPSAVDRPDLREIVLSSDLERWRRELTNDFERPVFARHAAVGEVKRALLASGAEYSSLSGSGSAVYGLFEEDGEANAAAGALRATGHRVWHGRV